MEGKELREYNRRATILRKMVGAGYSKITQHRFHRPIWWWALRVFAPRKGLMVFGRHEGEHNGVHRWGTFAVTINDCPPPWTHEEYQSITRIVQDLCPHYHDPVITGWKPIMNLGTSPDWL